MIHKGKATVPTGTLSVVMPNYNDVDHIAISLSAICEQSYSPVEVIVVDDGSIDNSVDIIQQAARKYTCIRLLQNGSNRGVNYSINRGAQEAIGDYIFFPAANDLVYPGFFEKAMDLLLKYPQAGLCYCDVRTILVKDGSSHHDTWMPVYGYFSPQQMSDMTAKNKYVFSACGSNSIIRKDLLSGDYVYMPELHTFGDWFLCKSIVFRHGCCYIPEPLVGVRCVEDYLSVRVSRDKVYYQQLCIRVIQLFASPDYEDIALLVTRSRVLRIMRPGMRTPGTVLKALLFMTERNHHANALLLHLTVEYFCTLFRNAFDAIAIPGRQLWREAKQSVHDTWVGWLCLLINLGDRAYARLFAKYDLAKAAVRRYLRI